MTSDPPPRARPDRPARRSLARPPARQRQAFPTRVIRMVVALPGRRPDRRDRAHRRAGARQVARPERDRRERRRRVRRGRHARGRPKAEPDGHTIMFGNNQTHGNNMFLLQGAGLRRGQGFRAARRRRRLRARLRGAEQPRRRSRSRSWSSWRGRIRASSTTARPASAPARTSRPSCSWCAPASG